MTVGDKIKYLRKSMGLNQTELGERVGVKKNAVSKWECGRVEDIPTSTIKALANLFNVSPSYLIDEEKEQPTVSGELSLENTTPLQRMIIDAVLKMPVDRQKALAEVLGLSE